MTFAKIIKGGPPQAKAAWKAATDTLESWLDNVALAPESWTDVYRYKWNPHLPMPVVGPNAYDYEVEAKSVIAEGKETVIKETDPSFWADQWDVAEVRRFIECLIPSFEEMKKGAGYQHIEPVYEELARKMGGKEAKRAFTWPVVLILATKK